MKNHKWIVTTKNNDKIFYSAMGESINQFIPIFDTKKGATEFIEGSRICGDEKTVVKKIGIILI